MRRSPIRRKRATPRNRKTVVRLTGAALAQLRFDCWMRDGGLCRDCLRPTYYTARFEGDPEAFDMAHIKSRGAGGSDTLENILCKCHRCHLAEHQGRKAREI